VRRLLTLAAIARVGAWVLAVHVIARPWRELGGVVDERLRWTAWLALWAACGIGITVGRFTHDVIRSRGRPSRLPGLRLALYPVLVVAAAGQVIAERAGAPDAGNAQTLALVAYVAGLDVALDVLPRLERGRPERTGSRSWVPPWERL